MCGIAGLVRFAGLRAGEREVGAAMAATLPHRGPDESGTYGDEWASFGHKRLSIIDLEGGGQPLGNEDGSIWVCFNGEIYNYRELAEGLQKRGHRLRTQCDTEVIVHLYEDFGESFVEYLNGMFAIALWDKKKRTLILARDRLGIKPLYWHDDGRRVLFGSELKALLAVGDWAPQIDPCALSDYFTFGHVPAPRTIYRSVRKLEPGVMAVCTVSGTSLRRYWDIPFRDDAGQRGESAWVEEFAAGLEDAVGLQMVADVPLGAFLSGGVDSSTIVAAMCRRASGRVLTQTAGFREDTHDERAAARRFAERLHCEHCEFIVAPETIRAAEHLAHYFDEPFADSSAIPTYYLSQAARERVTVALSGDGGDEMLAGYRRYRFDLAEARWRAQLPNGVRRMLGVIGSIYPKADWLPRPLRAKRTLQNMARDDATAHLRSISLAAGELPGMLLRPDVLEETGGYDSFLRGRELFARCSSRALLNRLLYMDMKTLLPDDMLTKVDRASMAVGLEVRVPLLDHRLVELTARMPTTMKLNGTTGKHVLRRTLAGWVGDDIANRPKKGFDVPLDEWFRGPLNGWMRDLLTTRDTLCGEWIDPAAIRRTIDIHQSGLRRHGAVLWTLCTLELWARRHHHGARAGLIPDAAPTMQVLSG